mgnify:CR=1 FL=1
MSIILKSENDKHIVTANGHKIIFDDLKFAIHYIAIVKRER